MVLMLLVVGGLLSVGMPLPQRGVRDQIQDPLAFEVPAINQHEKRIFAHYFPPYPISLDNSEPETDYYTRHCLDPEGEGGIHAASGGLLRDRPLARDPLTGDWAQADLVTEVNQAADAGIDGFFVDILSLTSANWDRTVELMEAADGAGRGFVLVPQLDATADAGQQPLAEVAAKMAQLAGMPAAYRLDSGEFVLSAFKAENHPPQWWSQLMDILKDEHGITTVFMPVFLDARYLDDYSGISYAMGDWGLRNPGHVVAAPDRAAQAHALNSRWIAPVSVQDVRPSQGVFWESVNLRNLRATWARAIEDDADFVLLVTWNDYSESTSFAPSMAHGYVFLDVSAYYATWFKTGSAPTIVRDAMYVTHRTQPFGAEPTLAHRLMVLQHGNRNPAQDTVEVQTFFTAEAQVRVQIGSAAHTYTAPAGVYVRSFPLVHGSVEASALRDGRPIAVVASPFEVTLQPDNQDLQYYAVSSRR